MKKQLKKQKGAALVVVLILFSMVFILTAATATAVNFESKHSIVDENQTKAYYLARSAVETVSKAIGEEINNLNAVKTLLDNTITEYNANLNNATDLTTYNNYVTALGNYNTSLDYVKANILPIGSINTYEHTVQGISNVGSVKVKSVTGAYRLEASSTINGSSAKAILNMNIITNPTTYTLKRHNTSTTSTVEDVTTTTTIPGNSPASFSNAFYSYGSIDLDNNIDLTTNGSLTTPANAKYRGVRDGKMGIDIGNVTKDTSTDVPLAPISLLPIDVSVDTRYTTMQKVDNLPSTLTSANNGYYEINEIPSNTSYTVDTSAGDVVLKLNRLKFENNASFNVTGANHFYIYIDDNNLTDGGLAFAGNNDVEFTSHDDKPRTFIIINQPVSDQISVNKIEIKNKLTLYGYIYAPYSSLEFKNSAEVSGSIIAADISAKNNLKIKHSQPNSGSNTGGGGGSQIVTTTTHTTVSVTTPVTTETNYSLDVIPVSISKNWMPK